jgi:allophanate hydrolase subunit 2
MPDAPTVGGYPVPAVVAAVDHCITAQLRPGDELAFEWAANAAMRTEEAERQVACSSIARSLG